MRNNGPGVTTIAAVAVLVAGGGCGVGGGTLTGTGGSAPAVAGPGGNSAIVGTGGAGLITTTGLGGGMNCGGVAQSATPLSPQIEIVLDTSASMNEPADPTCGAGCLGPSKWAASVTAINAVVDASPADVRWELSFIGGAPDTCELGPFIGGGAVKAGLQLLTSGGALDAPGMRPTRGAIDRVTARLGLNGASDPRVILLITDGMPNCSPGASDAQADDVAGSITSISDARANGTSTFVVGLGISGVPTDTALSNMAIAGGSARSGSPAYFPSSSSADLVATMNALVASMACEFSLPPAANDGTIWYDDIGVSAGDYAIPQDLSDGWSYTDATHATIQLHGSACATVQSTRYAVTISFRCLVQ